MAWGVTPCISSKIYCFTLKRCQKEQLLIFPASVYHRGKINPLDFVVGLQWHVQNSNMIKKAGYSCRITTGKQSSSSAEHISPWESSITLLARPGSRVAIWTFRDDNNHWTHYFVESRRGWCKTLVAALEKLKQVALKYQEFSSKWCGFILRVFVSCFVILILSIAVLFDII